MKTILKILGDAVRILLLATIIFPIGWFAWRAGQPMELPQYNGLTYYQFVSWRKMAYHELAVDYQVAHPDNPMHGGLDVCFITNTGVSLFARFPLAGFETLAGVFPNLKKLISPRDWMNIPEDVTLQTFLPQWWGIFEKFIWSAAEYSPNSATIYCRLPPDVPTPEEFQAIRNNPNQQPGS
jgi:hypothetical protein